MKRFALIGVFLVLFFASGVFAYDIAYDGFESGNFNGGTGWNGGWYKQGSPTKVINTDGPFSGSYHLKLQGANGYAERNVNLASFSNAKLSFYAKANSLESNDYADFLVSSDGLNWNVLKTFTPSDSDNTYHYFEFDLTQYGLSDPFWIAVDTQMNSNSNDYIYFDEFKITSEINVTIPEIPTWHIQFNPTPVNPAADVEYWNLDLYDVPSETMQSLHNQGTFVMCYFSAGSWEDWRPDADDFPSSCLGNSNGWPGEKWLDTRCPEVRAIMQARMDYGIAKGCDGFDPDNMDAYGNGNTGFPLTEQDAIDYFDFLAAYVHSQGKQIGLKNALTMIDDVLPNMDWAINEQCYEYSECGYLNQVLFAGKPVFHIEYPQGGQTHEELADLICGQSNSVGMATLIKNQQLDEFEISCLEFGGETNDSLIASDGFENGWESGAGWLGGWWHEGDSAIVTSGTPYEGNYHLRLRKNNGYVDRQVDLSGRDSARISFWAKAKSFENGDSASFLVSSDGLNWSVLNVFTRADSDNTYKYYEFDLAPYGLTSTFWVAFDAEMSDTGDYLYVDEVKVATHSIGLMKKPLCRVGEVCTVAPGEFFVDDLQIVRS